MKVASFERCARATSGVYHKLLSAIIQQPTSVAVDGSDFQLYGSGIYDGNCSSTDINWGVTIISIFRCLLLVMEEIMEHSIGL